MKPIVKHAKKQQNTMIERRDTLKRRIHKLEVMRDNITSNPQYCTIMGCMDEYHPEKLAFEVKRDLVRNRIIPLTFRLYDELHILNRNIALLDFVGQMEDRGCFKGIKN